MSGYDETLLKDAPEASRAERQKGYNIDILAPERPQSPPPAPTSSAPPGPSFPPGSGESEFATGTSGLGAKEYGSISQEEDGGAPRPDAKPVSFWRTTKGKLLIGLIALIVIAAIVGGAIGGVNSSKGGSKTSNTSTTNSTLISDSTTSQPNTSGAETNTKSPHSVSNQSGGGSKATSSKGNGAQRSSTTDSTPALTTTTTTSIAITAPPVSGPGMAFAEGGATAGSSRDRRRYPLHA